MTTFLLLSDSSVLVDVGCSLWQEDGSVVYNSCWPRQHSHSQVRVLWDSWPFLLSQIRDYPFRCLLRLAGLRWRYSTPLPHRLSAANTLLLYRRSTDHSENTASSIVARCLCWGYHVIASQPVHWYADCCLAASCNIRPYRTQLLLLCVGTCLWSHCHTTLTWYWFDAKCCTEK
jgi:hypothetical protein